MDIYIYTSSDYGASWQPQTSGLPESAGWVSITSSGTGQYLAATVANYDIYTSRDYGVTWTEQTSNLPTTAKWQYRALSSDGTRLAAVINGGTGTSSGIYTGLYS